MKHFHPKRNDQGHLVELKLPSQPSNYNDWLNSMGPFTVVPQGEVPSEIDGIETRPWIDVPDNDADWERLASTASFEEPEFSAKQGKIPASGVVIIEDDGQVWIVSPSNQYGGYVNTFPKGKISQGSKLSLRANALKEAFEESGLKVELTGFLVDSDRTTTTTRYYLARRVGGNPADMGWESQAVHLIPRHLLPMMVTHPNDSTVLAALREKTPRVMKTDIMMLRHLSSVHRILETIEGFKNRHGAWPTRLLLDTGMAEAIPGKVLTEQAWGTLKSKIDVLPVDNGTVVAEADATFRYDYSDSAPPPIPGNRADEWIWGLQLYSSEAINQQREAGTGLPTYLIEKIARHGAAALRLKNERASSTGEFAEHSEISAIAFDAADFVWAYLALQGNDKVQESREVRNQVAEAIIAKLGEYPDLDFGR